MKLSRIGNMGLRRKPYAFTELGVAMLSSVLNSKMAIQINMGIMRAFVSVRRYILQASPSSLSRELEQIKERIKALEDISEENEEKFDDVYIALTQLAMKQKLAATPPQSHWVQKTKERIRFLSWLKRQIQFPLTEEKSLPQ